MAGLNIDLSEVVNATVEGQTTDIQTGTTYNLTIKANSGYSFKTAPTVYFENEYDSWSEDTTKISDTEYTYSLLIAEIDGVTAISITANAEQSEASGINIDVTQVANATIDGQTNNIQPLTHYNYTINANDGYVFKTTPAFIFDNGVDSWTEECTKVTNKQYTYDLYIDEYTTVETISITANAVEETGYEDKYGVICIYKMTPATLKLFAQNRFYADTDKVQDLGEFVTQMKREFITIPATTESYNLILGNYTLKNVSAPFVKSDNVITECGTISIPKYYGNEMDYTNTTIEIYLPFVNGMQKLETEKVMGNELKVTYHTNPITADTLITVEINGVVNYTYNCNVGFDIPYFNEEDVGNKKIGVNSAYLIDMTPYILITRNKQNNEEHTHVENLYSKIGDLTGYKKFSYVDININATESECNDIISKLQQGVIL